MSHYGSPPDPDPNQPDPGASGSTPGPSEPAPSEPAPYNPYPDNWNSAPQNPQNPYGQQNPYGAPAQPPPGAPGGPANPYAGPVDTNRPTFAFNGYAGWWTRVGAWVIDYIAGALASAPALVGYVVLLSNTSTTTNPDGTTTSHYSGSIGVPLTLILIGAVTGIAFFVWNICIRQGRTGASVGKSVLAVRLVNSDMQPIGGGWAFLRYLLHIVDSICYIGYLWPIWDSHKQTFADKIMSTYVIHAGIPQPRVY
jgi:uncharacterized RDD family membrane protein YckC